MPPAGASVRQQRHDVFCVNGVVAGRQLTGFKVVADTPCRFSDGARVVTIRVAGNNDEVMDARKPFMDRGYRITDLNRGENGFLASGELDAHARANFGDLALVIDISIEEG